MVIHTCQHTSAQPHPARESQLRLPQAPPASPKLKGSVSGLSRRLHSAVIDVSWMSLTLSGGTQSSPCSAPGSLFMLPLSSGSQEWRGLLGWAAQALSQDKGSAAPEAIAMFTQHQPVLNVCGWAAAVGTAAGIVQPWLSQRRSAPGGPAEHMWLRPGRGTLEPSRGSPPLEEGHLDL